MSGVGGDASASQCRLRPRRCWTTLHPQKEAWESRLAGWDFRFDEVSSSLPQPPPRPGRRGSSLWENFGRKKNQNEPTFFSGGRGSHSRGDTCADHWFCPRIPGQVGERRV